jgi:phage terminase small subunit
VSKLVDELPHPKQQCFVREYIKDFNATQAAIRAGYSAKTAQQQSSRLLLNVVVKAAIAELVEERSERTKIEADDVVVALARLGFAHLGNYHRIAPDGFPYLDMSEITDEQWAALKRIKVKKYKDGKGEDARDVIETEIEMVDKVRPLIELGKHLGLFKPDKKDDADPAELLATEESRRIDHLSELAERYKLAPPAKSVEVSKPKGKVKVS